MNVEFAEIELRGQTYVFGEGFNLSKGEKIRLPLNKLNVADLEIIAAHISSGSIKSNISQEVFIQKALELRQKFQKAYLGDEVSTVEVLEIQETKQVEVEVLSKEEEVGETDQEIADRIFKEILDKKGSQVIVAIRAWNPASEKEVDIAIGVESSEQGANRKNVIAALQSKKAIFSL